MNKSQFPHDRKQQKHPFQSHGGKPQSSPPGQGHSNPSHQHGNNSQGQNPNKPQQWPGQKEKR